MKKRPAIHLVFKEGEEWILAAMSKMRRELEDMGIRIPEQALIKKALEKVFSKYRDVSYRPSPPPQKVGKVGTLKIRLEGKDAWLGDVLKKLTNLKISLGLDPNCTPEKEFVRLAINGYKNIKIGTELDRILLEKDDATPE